MLVQGVCSVSHCLVPMHVAPWQVSGQAVNSAGEIKANGMVKCAQHVGGPQNHECSLSEFEKLGNSKERRPGENIHLTNYSIALKVQPVPCQWFLMFPSIKSW